MSNRIVIHFREVGRVKEEFRHEGRAGGSYTKRCKLEEGWCIVIDEWGKQVAFPADIIAKVEIDE